MKKSNILSFIAGAVLFGTTGVFAGQYIVTENPFPIMLNGEETQIEGYNINDSTYFRLRDIADVVGGFRVDFKDSTILLSNKSKTEGLSPIEVVKSYMIDITSGNYDGLEEYATEDAKDDVIIETTAFSDMIVSVDELEELNDFSISLIVKKATDILLSNIEYVIDNSRIDGNNAYVDITLSIPDYQSITEDSMVKEIFGVTSDEDYIKIMADANGMTVDGLNDFLASATDGEMVKVYSEFTTYVYDKFFEYIKKTAPDLPKLSEKFTVELVNIDGSWKISKF